MWRTRNRYRRRVREGDYHRMPVQEVYEMARKKGIPHDDSLSREELLNKIFIYEEETIEDETRSISYSREEEITSREMYYDAMSVQELYEIARKKGVRHNDSMSRDQLIEILSGYDEESRHEPPEHNAYAAKNPATGPKGEENTIEE